MLFPRTINDWNRFSKLMIVLSIIFMGIGVVSAIRTFLFLHSAVPETGEIIKLIERKNYKKDTLYTPVFTFRDHNGNIHTVFSAMASHHPVGNAGDRIAILYNPDNPKHAEVNSFVSIWGFSAIFGGLGAFFFIVFWIVAIVTRNKMDSDNKALQVPANSLRGNDSA